MTSLSNSSQSSRPDECFGKNYSFFLDFTRNYDWKIGFFLSPGFSFHSSVRLNWKKNSHYVPDK